MSQVTLFGSRASKRAEVEQTPRSRHGFRNFLITIFAILTFFEGFYFYLCYTNNGFVSRWRNI